MNKFIRRAFNKIEKLSTDEIKTLVRYQASENELLGNVFQKIDIGVIVSNGKGRVLTCNDTAKRLIPLSRPLSEGTSLKYVLGDQDLANFMLQAIETTSAEEGVEKEFNFQHGDRVRTLCISVSAFISELDPVFDQDTGNRILFLVRDISEEKRQESRLHRSESLASLTTVAAGVAHEIKNPLASIGIHLQLLRKAFQRKKHLTLADASRYLDIIDEEIERLNGIVVDFLFAVRPMDVRLRLENLNSVIEDVCSFVSYELSGHNITINRQLGEFLPKIRLDENLLKQALLNIIKNAMNAMEGHGGTLTVATKLMGDHVTISLSDTGVGMDEVTLAKIFEPYFTTKSSGSGLGLTMVFKVVKEHLGEISVSSKKGVGTTFTITLPVPTSERLALEEAYPS
ncbi:MAG: ATP-binding protein [Sphaerochaetaceae bacterium]|jgi:signal transduction histidine kinase|nr:ATP-binding protein [Sphaerochaetaceae bacterium]MDD3365824.1 ATP-binding protein [Sphaerochaetaceae bacterium]MDD4218909.1 ATP-binding protein [Sphaerochaetaceae bacterium]MDY0370967.1 ATP-binding protein [Sphaerochaetaceae bacterium]